MVDVGAKPLSRRRATAQATLRVAPETASRLSQLPKGDAVAAAKLAGIMASAETTAQTGVEMEALVAATIAALTVYDMAKAIDSSMELSEVRLVEKTKEPVE